MAAPPAAVRLGGLRAALAGLVAVQRGELGAALAELAARSLGAGWPLLERDVARR